MTSAGIDTENHPIVLFDGYCNLCSGWVAFVIKYDEKRKFRFASLQSEAGKAVKSSFRVPEDYADSIVLVYRGRNFYKSAAALRILKLLGGIWQLLYVFIAVPPFLRNWVYDFIARHRYRWFGRRESCRVPTEEEQGQFL